jgi:tRNA pseudouridine38-40 synthase
MPTYRLTVEYEGTRYSGWQEQKNARTVAGELKQALGGLLEGAFELGGAGRTDAGVHALAQVAHLRAGQPLDTGRAVAGLAEALPADIHVVALEPAAPRFHARHDALTRSYVYQISRRRTALGKRYVWWVKRPLDAGAMGAALAAVVGRHDFARFAEAAPDPEASTLVEVERAELLEAGDLLVVRIAASHFLWKMVRRLVGTLVEVGAGALEPERFRDLVERGAASASLHPAEWTAPPSGLFLERVIYAGDPPLGALAPAVPVLTPPAAARAAPSRPAPRPPARPGRSNGRGRRGRDGGPRGRGRRPPR